MDNEFSLKINSKEVCPIIGDILNGLGAHSIIEKRKLAPEKNKDHAAILATAYLAAGSIFAAAIDSSASDLAEVADTFSDIFIKALEARG